ncbi:hypothetical protein L3Q82_004946 [Scortum barcoo]|uniref:Uncharacterized protein n=1 Tax=Scortum barcoo TaxID=214431 RepID=A0ACB8VDR9_9TELE|nr:hypothetical protein L3Q82_004946 [Scortum barcoo]
MQLGRTKISPEERQRWLRDGPIQQKVQQFLGFANFYRKFIRNLSAVAAPLHALTTSKVSFQWTSEANEAFQNLKQRFTTAHVLTVPDPQRQFVVEVIHWAHTSLLMCHPGIKRTMFMIKQEKKVSEYVAACPVGTCNKTLPRAQMGLLHPLPSPQWPWSHISVDFVTGLPPSKGKTTILTVVDHFSKMAHFIPLTKLPSAKEMKEFCQLLGATVSMSSSYHPQPVDVDMWVELTVNDNPILIIPAPFLEEIRSRPLKYLSILPPGQPCQEAKLHLIANASVSVGEKEKGNWKDPSGWRQSPDMKPR